MEWVYDAPIKDKRLRKIQSFLEKKTHDKKASELDWFYHLTGGVTHTDFFALRPTDYSKANEGEDWNDGLWD